MIVLKELTYKNIMSVGNHPMKVRLDQANTTVVGGRNGSGKSTIFLSLVYCLYGKVLNGMKIAQVINTINQKNLFTTVEFERNGEEWRVERGEKPKKFDIYRNGEKLDKYANVRDQQKFLDLILGVDFKTFVQLIVINKERYVPFMDMGAPERRKIIEDTLGISVFRFMNDILKDELSESKRVYTNLEKDRSLKQAELKGTQNLIKELQTELDKAEAQSEEYVNSLKDELNVLDAKIKNKQDELDELSTEGWDKTKKRLNELGKLSIQFEAKITSSKKTINFFKENDNCPTCKQELSSDLVDYVINEETVKIDKVNSTVKDMMGMVEELSKKNTEYESINDKYSQLTNELNQLIYEKNSVDKAIKHALEASNLDSKRQTLETYINTYTKEESLLEALTEEMNVAHEEHQSKEMLKETLKDDGVKSFIVNEYLNVINKKINEYLNAMEFYLNIKLDENFNESFHSMNREGLTYENLSSGQKMRVNLAITLALLEVSAIRNGISINIMCLDELLEPIDKEGVIDVMNLFKQQMKDKNIFVVTQRFDEFEDLFDTSLRFVLNNGFTESLN